VGHPSLAPAHDELLAVRVALHRQAGRALDDLLLQEQDGVAAALAEADADTLMARVASAARTIAFASDDGWQRVSSWLAGPRGHGGGRDRPLGRGLVLRDGEVALEPSTDVAADPSLALRAGAAAASLGIPLAPAALTRLGQEAPPPGDPWPAGTRNALVALLGTGPPMVAAMEALDQHGLVVRLLPEWEAVRNRPQRNAYHRFTVDRHLNEAAAGAAALTRNVSRPDLLLVGAWLHDIGKGFPGDHTETGVVVMRTVATRMGFAPGDVDTLVAMVRHHLLLADVATRRDLDDPATADAVAAAVGDGATLDLLAALTEADSLATGPAAWGAWKAGLVSDLVARTAQCLEGRAEAPATTLPTPDHRRLMAEGNLQVLVDGTVVTVVAPDRTGLLACVAGTLALHGLAVLSASVATDQRGMAVEVLEVDPLFGRRPDAERLRSDLADALEGRLPLEARLAQRASDYAAGRRPSAARPAEPRVLVDNEASAAATVVEVRAADAVGVLYRVTRALAASGVDVSSAKVSTLGHEVVDSFYVRDASGSKVCHPDAVDGLRTAILRELTPAR
jgi:[protein-PII] uridylyltransferase